MITIDRLKSAGASLWPVEHSHGLEDACFTDLSRIIDENGKTLSDEQCSLLLEIARQTTVRATVAGNMVEPLPPLFRLIDGNSFSGKSNFLLLIRSVLRWAGKEENTYIGSPCPTAAVVLGGITWPKGEVRGTIKSQHTFFLIDDSMTVSKADLGCILTRAAWNSALLGKGHYHREVIVLVSDSSLRKSTEDSWFDAFSLKDRFKHTTHFFSPNQRPRDYHSEILRLYDPGKCAPSNETPTVPILITPTKSICARWNTGATITFADEYDVELITSDAYDSLSHTDLSGPDSIEEALDLLSIGGPPHVKIHLCMHMPVTVVAGEFQGYWGIIDGIGDGSGTKYQPEWVRIRLENTVGAFAESITIYRTATMHVASNLPNIVLTRVQLPISARFALMESEMVGLTVDGAFIDNCLGLQLFENLLYTLSRIKRTEDIRFVVELEARDRRFLRKVKKVVM
ncbi:hypothetical protein BDP27DRAFT_1546098 [Rhodocollybia butyracea]|uniref:Uncharacterized protein n=1 Tax=Rhodocollybia butyracea TaxID=206335 RepID=A0A9P5PN27_9AGAR|nr:hypothetical protein BDP27DRAFT_1546098 [Rhodocollybia butyracea]